MNPVDLTAGHTSTSSPGFLPVLNNRWWSGHVGGGGGHPRPPGARAPAVQLPEHARGEHSFLAPRPRAPVSCLSPLVLRRGVVGESEVHAVTPRGKTPRHSGGGGGNSATHFHVWRMKREK